MINKKTSYVFVLCLTLFLNSCSQVKELESPNAEELESPDAEEVTRIGNECEDVVKSQINTWNTREAENLRKIYTDDIVHFDGSPAYVGIDEVVAMAKRMYGMFPNWQMETGEVYISKDKCFGSWVNWGVMGLTQENPGVEYDLLETRDNKISFWRLFYDQNFGFSFIDNELLSQFATIWSQGDVSEIKIFYSEDAKLEDTLFGVSADTQQKIAAYAESIFTKSPEASWELLTPFAETSAKNAYHEQYPFSSQGGVFVIRVDDANGDTCEIRSIVILTPDGQGKIQAQETFYDADTLMACGWVK
jgi:hypothetical protein